MPLRRAQWRFPSLSFEQAELNRRKRYLKSVLEIKYQFTKISMTTCRRPYHRHIEISKQNHLNQM